MAAIGSGIDKRVFHIVEEHVQSVATSQDPEKILNELVNLGIHILDQDAHSCMMNKIIDVVDPNSVFVPSNSDPGIFFVYNLKDYSEAEKTTVLKEIRAGLIARKPCESIEPTAVFKIGAQRAQMELIARKIAFLTGLAPFAICGCFYSLKNPNLSVWSGDFAAEEVLWNGAVKQYNPVQEDENARVIGILEPFLKRESHSKQKKKELFAMIVTLALVIGWRDGKDCNREDALTDLEECMPRMLTPAFEPAGHITPDDFIRIRPSGSFVAATHLPFLEDDDFTNEPFNRKDLLKLCSIVAKWDIEEIIREISGEMIRYPDYVCETEDLSELEENMKHSDEASGAESSSEVELTIKDENFCAVKLSKDELMHEDHLYKPKFLSGTTPALDEEQIYAFRDRLERIKAYFLSKKEKTTPADLVRSVDPFYWRHLELVRTGKKIAERKETLSASLEPGKSPGAAGSSHGVRFSSASPVQSFLALSIAHPGRGAVPASIMTLNTPGARNTFMEAVMSTLQGTED